MFHVEQSTEERLIREILLDPRLNLDQSKIPDSAVPHLLAYTRLWHKWNAKISLTAEKAPDLFIRNHLFVSLQFLQGVENAQGLVDIGSGAGLPGIPLKILRPDLPTLLVECRRKRASFLMTVVRELGLKNVQVADTKVEAITSPGIPIDTAVFRAVADTPTCLEWARGIMPQGGRVVLLRTPKEAERPDLSDSAIKCIDKFSLEDFESHPLVLLVFHI